MNRRWWLASVASLPVVAALSDDAAHAGDKKPRPRKKRWSTLDPRERLHRKHFHNVELQTHDGETVRFYDDLIKGKIVAFNFMYATCKGSCVPSTANLRRVHALLGPRMGKDVFFYSLTLKPEEDSVEMLRKYTQVHKVGVGWKFLTGRPQDLELLRRSLGFTDPNPERDADKANHLGLLRFGNEPRMLWAGCPALSDAAAIAKSIRSVG